jgi:hypothetical protein
MAARKPKRRVRRATTRRPATRRPRRASNGGNVWSRQEIAFMRKYYRKYPTAWVARQLGRTVYSVRYKASDLSIKKARPSIWRENGTPSRRKTTRKATPRKRTTRRPTRRTRRPARRATAKRKISRKAKPKRKITRKAKPKRRIARKPIRRRR